MPRRHWHSICIWAIIMVDAMPQSSKVNLLASQGCWAWPRAVAELFEPRGINLIVVDSPSEFIQVLRQQRIYATIVDADAGMGQLAALRAVRTDYPPRALSGFGQ